MVLRFRSETLRLRRGRFVASFCCVGIARGCPSSLSAPSPALPPGMQDSQIDRPFVRASNAAMSFSNFHRISVLQVRMMVRRPAGQASFSDRSEDLNTVRTSIKIIDVLCGDVLCLVFQFALCLRSMRSFCGVSRRWARAVTLSESWAGKVITTWNADMGRERLLRWWPTWRLCMRVCLSSDQWRAYPLPAPTRYTVWYDWGTWNASLQDEWHSVCVFGDDSLACLSEDAVPDSFGLYKVQEFGTCVLIGWSTARTPCELELMFERWQRSDSHAYDRILWTRIYAVRSQEAEAVRRQQRRGWFTYRALFDNKDWEIAQLHLDRRTRAVHIATNLMEPLPSSSTCAIPVQEEAELRFFMVIPNRPDCASLPSALILANSE